MPIQVACSGCGKTLRLADTHAGKRARCPGCNGIVQVPEAGSTGKEPAGSLPTGPQSVSPTGRWYVKTADGQDFGPISNSQLDAWVAEGRVTAESQVLREGAQQWQWAHEVFPALARQQSGATSAGISIQSGGEIDQISVDTDRDFRSGSKYRSRQYPAMQVTRAFYNVFAWAIIVIGVLTGTLTLIGTARQLSVVRDEWAVAGVIVITLITIVALALYVTFFALTLWFVAEAIKMAIDIEDNTHRSAQYLQRLLSRKE